MLLAKHNDLYYAILTDLANCIGKGRPGQCLGGMRVFSLLVYVILIARSAVGNPFVRSRVVLRQIAFAVGAAHGLRLFAELSCSPVSVAILGHVYPCSWADLE